jgi:2-oxo-hept-3-ene-1,7-dioate hydratase
MLTPDQIAKAAADLMQAEQTRTQIGLLSRRHPLMTMEDAYAVQAGFVAAKMAVGGRQVGWKIGLTSRAMQQALNITTPDSGVLTEDMLFEDGAAIPANRFIQPRIEAELAFVMAEPLQGPDVKPWQVMAATAHIVPALEILDTRIVRVDPETRAGRTIVDTIADNAANAGIVTGGRVTAPGAVDLRWAGAIVSRNGVVEETGLGAGVLNDPARGVAWLANRLATLGQRIEAGQIVLSGSFIRPIEAGHGDTIHADFGPLGSVAVCFE